MADALTFHKVTKRYSNGKGIHNVTLTVPQGGIFGFLGPNGAGKTTTIRTIMDFIRPTSGAISVLGMNSHMDSDTIKQQVGYVPADRQMYLNWTGRQHLDFYQSSRPKTKTNIASRLHLDLATPVKHLSTGNKQKLAITLALCGRPKLLLMDEPTAGLDPLLQQEIYEILREYTTSGGTVFLSSHNLAEVEKICDQIGIIKDGTIIANKSMGDIRDMSIHVVSVVTPKPLDAQVTHVSNVEITNRSANHTLLKVKGDLNPLLRILAQQQVSDLEISHASLEDIFLEFYS